MHYAGARYYMSARGKFGIVDPMADSYKAWSSYHYAPNNPLRVVDPTRKFLGDISRSTGEITAARYGSVSGHMWMICETSPRAIPLMGEGISTVFASLKDFTIGGFNKADNTKHSVLDESVSFPNLAKNPLSEESSP
jgi:hypothetical protein